MRILLLVVGILGGVMPALAQTPADEHPTSPASATAESPDSSSATNATTPSFGDTLVVTASAEEEEVDDLSSSVTVIERAEIEARQATTVLELLRTVPGVDVVRSGSPGKVSSVFLRGANSNQTLALWNGVKLNDPYFQGFDWSFLDTAAVDRIEVVRGPVSSLWGSEAIGGVVQVLTGERRGVTLGAEAGEDGYARGSASAGLDLGSAGHLDVAGWLRRGDGQVDNDFYDAEGLTARADWQLDPATTLGLVGRVADSEVGLPFGFAGPTPNRVQERRSVQLTVPFTRVSESPDGAGAWQVEAQVSTADLDLSVRDGDDPFGSRDTEAGRDAGRVQVTWSPGESRDSGRTLWIAGGADWQREEASNRTAFGTNLDGERQESWATFAEVWFGGEAWSLDVGVRRDDNDVFGDETTVDVGGVVALGPDWRLRARWGQGFRAPSLGELFFPGSSNPNLEPETSEGAELGVEWSRSLGSGGRLLASLTAFDNDFDNLVVYPAPTFVPVNVGRAESSGLEALVDWRGPRWSLRLAGTRLDTENLDTGEELLRRPERSAHLVATWQATDRLGAHAVVRRVGERLDFGTTLDPYTTLDLGVRFAAGRGIEPYARLENALDEEYEEAAGFPAPPRTVVGGVTVEF